MGRLLVTLSMTCAALAPAGAPAEARSPSRAIGPSAQIAPAGAARAPITLAHSHAHGVVYRRGSLGARRAKADCLTSCAGPLFYLGGPVMHAPRAYAIFWEPTGTKFPPGYEAAIERFMQAVEHSAGDPLGNAFSVDLLYGDTEGPGDYGWKFAGALPDGDSLPGRDTTHCPEANVQEEAAEANGGFGLPPKGEPCVTDEQLQAELVSLVKAKGLQGGLENLYFLFTPEHVNSCAGGEDAQAECTTNSYCAYHYDVASETPHIIYANMPWADRPGCAIPDQPNGGPADDEIDLINHEGNESITDPLGGEIGEETAAWLAYSGNEIGDLCTYPFFDPAIDFNPALDAYGELLGGVAAPNETTPGTAYNQEIDGNHYLLQRMWSDAAEGCVSRAPVPVPSLSVYSSPTIAGQPVSFDGSGSSAGAGRLTSYSWVFGDGTGASEAAAVTHTYAKPGNYTVKLTVGNDSGASASIEEQVSVAAAPVSPPAPITITKTLTNTVTVPASVSHYSAAQLASLLGLPADGGRLSGLGPFSLGHAQCPPACGVTLQLYAKVTTVAHKHRTSKLAAIGSAEVAFAATGGGSLSLLLNAKGRALLRKGKPLACKLVAAVEGQEGGTWQIVRSLTLMGGHAARRARR